MPILALRLVTVIVVLAATAGAATASPAIFLASSPVRPDEAVLIAGHALVAPDSEAAATTVELAALDGPPRSPPAGPDVPLPDIRDCDVLASDFALYLVTACQGRIRGTTFLYGGRGYRIESSREIVFENNTIEGFGLAAIGNDIATF